MNTSEFLLPDVGEGLTEAEIVSWRVKVGDSVTVNQVVVEIETAKSLVELPSPFSGTVVEILVEEGQTVSVGMPIISVSSGGLDATAQDAADSAAEEKPAAVLVGYGIKGAVSSRRSGRRTGRANSPVSTAAVQAAAVQAVPVQAAAGSSPAIPIALPEPEPARANGRGALAKPPIRKLAKDLNVDLATVAPTGPVGDVTRDDVTRHAAQSNSPGRFDASDWPEDREERIAVKGVRKMTATAMTTSAFTAPHVSLFVDVDATRTMEFVSRLKASSDFADVRVSPLLIVAKALMWAVRRNPMVNAQWSDDEITVKNFVNLGIAVATPRGLIVPNIRDAHRMSLRELAAAINQLTVTAREGKTSPLQMADGTVTITNIGVFGMDSGTPILNTGEVAILALGTIKLKPWVVDGEVRPRYITTLGGSFDHRVVDGDVASRFLADVASIIEEPALLLD